MAAKRDARPLGAVDVPRRAARRCGRSSVRIFKYRLRSPSPYSDRVVPRPVRYTSGRSCGHAWQTFWTTMVGFGIGIVVGVVPRLDHRLVALHLQRPVPAAGRVQRDSRRSAFVPILVVWFGIGIVPGDPDRVPDLLLPDRGERRHRPRDASSPSSRTCCARSAPPSADMLLKVGLPRSHAVISSHRSKSRSRSRLLVRSSRRLVASNEGIGYLMLAAGSSMRVPLMFAGLDRHQRDGDGDVRALRGAGEADDRLGDAGDGRDDVAFAVPAEAVATRSGGVAAADGPPLLSTGQGPVLRPAPATRPHAA